MAEYKDQYGTWEHDGKGVISKFTPNEGVTKIEIPYEIDGVKIKVIKNSDGNTDYRNIEEITFHPESEITSIGPWAFSSCRILKKMELPPKVTSIDYAAFYGSEALEEIKIPDGVTCIDAKAFKCCKALKRINMPNEVCSIGYEAFMGCRALEQIEIPDNVFSFGHSAFRGCVALKKINIPVGLALIGNCDAIFSDCTALAQMTITNPCKLEVLKKIFLDSNMDFPGNREITITIKSNNEEKEAFISSCEDIENLSESDFVALNENRTRINWKKFWGALGIVAGAIIGAASTVAAFVFAAPFAIAAVVGLGILAVSSKDVDDARVQGNAQDYYESDLDEKKLAPDMARRSVFRRISDKKKSDKGKEDLIPIMFGRKTKSL